jgi:hypothetical protein
MEANPFWGIYVIRAPSVSTGDGGRNVAGEYLVAEPLDYFHFAEAPDWVYGLALQRVGRIGAEGVIRHLS